YNWLITDCCAYPEDEDIEELLSREYCFISGEELDTIIKKEYFQLIWGVLSGFNKKFTLEEIMKYTLPYAEDNKDIWENPVCIQHPLSEIEIISWDSDKTVLISKDENLLICFISKCPFREELELYNRKIQNRVSNFNKKRNY
ncbi:hypothetical protein, partial [Clostridium perfringens]|uniref:hypothetical protein n=1 Tax=Clostridium perfringens TaxID=1502 RepID=UPI003F42B25D